MISLRQHIFSLVAVFVALAVGIAAPLYILASVWGGLKPI